MKLPLNDNKFLYLIILAVIVLSLEILSHFRIDIPLPYSTIIYSIVILTSGWVVLKNGVKALCKLNFGNINLLILIVVIAAYYLGDYIEATSVIVLYILGEKLENIGIENSLSITEHLINDTPKTALVKSRGCSIPIDIIKIGTIIQIKPYEQIPLDGIIEKGETSIDESSVTGKLLPMLKTKGDSVFAGTWNKNGFIEICTTKEYKDSTFSKIISLIKTSQTDQADIQNFIERFAKIYTPIVIFCAIMLIIVFVFILHHDFQKCLHQSIILLLISCPCGLVISTPVAIYAALGNISSKGILIKRSNCLEVLARIKAVGLKIRAITHEKLTVSDVIPLNGVSKEELLNCGAKTELCFEHSIVQTIAEISKKKILFLTFMERHSRISKEINEIIDQLSALGKTSIIVSCEEKIKGIIGLSNKMKSDSIKAISELQSMSIETIIIAGDNQQPIQCLTNKVNIKNVFKGLLPYDKAEKIKILKQKYKYVAMVGDGITDAVALATASVGIAIGTTDNNMAIEIADIALMNDKLSLLPFLIRLARKTVKTIRWNTFGAIVVKFIFILLAFTGYNNLVLAIMADVGVTLIVVLISLRLMQYR